MSCIGVGSVLAVVLQCLAMVLQYRAVLLQHLIVQSYNLAVVLLQRLTVQSYNLAVVSQYLRVVLQRLTVVL